MEPIHSSSSSFVPSMSVEHAVKRRRAKSMTRGSCNGDEEEPEPSTAPPGENKDAYTEAGGRSSAHANSKRRRSQSQVQHRANLSAFDYGSGELDLRVSRPNTPRPRTSSPISIEPSSRDNHCRKRSRFSRQYTTSAHRTPSRGRRRRRGTPHPTGTDEGRGRQESRGDNISRQIRPSGSRHISSSTIVNHTSSIDVEDSPSYHGRGIFWTPSFRGPDEFRVPKSRNETEPKWSPGDGFSDVEAQPEFMFLMTGRPKRKHSRALPALGQLTVESEGAGQLSKSYAPKSQSCESVQHDLHIPMRRTEVRDLWPTRENFADSSIAPRNNDKTQGEYTVTETTPSKAPTPTSKISTRPRKRQRSVFWSFGRSKQRPESWLGNGLTLSPAVLSLQDIRDKRKMPADEVAQEGMESPYYCTSDGSEDGAMTDEESESECIDAARSNGQYQSNHQDDEDADIQDNMSYRGPGEERSEEVSEISRQATEKHYIAMSSCPSTVPDSMDSQAIEKHYIAMSSCPSTVPDSMDSQAIEKHYIAMSNCPSTIPDSMDSQAPADGGRGKLGDATDDLSGDIGRST